MKYAIANKYNEIINYKHTLNKNNGDYNVLLNLITIRHGKKRK